MTRQEIQGEINACKQLLADSDYSIIKTLEGLLSCTTATGMIAYLKDLTGDLTALVKQRQAWRDKVNNLEALFETATDDEQEVIDPGEPAESTEPVDAAE